MEATLQGLAELLLKAVPTIIFFALLTLYLKHVFFKPLARILDERKRATEGVRQLAQQAFAAADQKSSEFQRNSRSRTKCSVPKPNWMPLWNP
jgi:F0F1-type ATP synthase membrane subunit b/b'